MPKDFNDCVKNGGKVITKKLKGDKYIRICYDKDGTAHEGEVKKKKTSSKNKKIESSRLLVEKLKRLKKFYDEEYHRK
jgi:hypothetical protein